jgi:hypothetical protein
MGVVVGIVVGDTNDEEGVGGREEKKKNVIPAIKSKAMMKRSFMWEV